MTDTTMTPVMILNTPVHLKAANLCDRLVWNGIGFSFNVIGECFCVTVAQMNVKRALDAK